MSYYSHSDPPNCYSSTASAELKLYQAFIFSVPIFFTFILLFLFYLFYLRRRRVDWASLRMRSSLQSNNNINDLSRAELGLKKELREMLPIIIYKESFSIKDTQCSVCLAEYQAEDKLQQIPACGHAFHMDCIDHWLATHTTCPLCRLSLITSAKAPNELPDIQEETSQESSATEEANRESSATEEANRESSAMEDSDGASDQPRSQACEETQAVVEHSESSNGDARAVQNSSEGEGRSASQCVDQGRKFRDTRNETKEHDHSRGIPA